jgi:hypothetical protein
MNKKMKTSAIGRGSKSMKKSVMAIRTISSTVIKMK